MNAQRWPVTLVLYCQIGGEISVEVCVCGNLSTCICWSSLSKPFVPFDLPLWQTLFFHTWLFLLSHIHITHPPLLANYNDLVWLHMSLCYIQSFHLVYDWLLSCVCWRLSLSSIIPENCKGSVLVYRNLGLIFIVGQHYKIIKLSQKYYPQAYSVFSGLFSFSTSSSISWLAALTLLT